MINYKLFILYGQWHQSNKQNNARIAFFVTSTSQKRELKVMKKFQVPQMVPMQTAACPAKKYYF